MDRREAELIEGIREHRTRLASTLETLDERLAVLSDLPARAARVARWTAIVVAVTTVGVASVLLVRALTRPRARRPGWW